MATLGEMESGFLRMVPTFVNAHMFRASRKQWFESTCAGVDIGAINYATKHRTKIKAKFSYCDQINLMNLYLNQGE